MHSQSVRIALAMLIAFAVSSESMANEKKEEHAAVRAAVDGFYAALNRMFAGDVKPMEQVWSHKDDVTYMGPRGGFKIGWKKVQAEWKLQADLKLGGKVEAKDMRITVGRDLAIVSNYENGKNSPAGDKSRDVTIRATNLFRKENGNWKMIGHHTDTLPFLRK